ncbi:MAG TPA: SDR family NAD(P)-dependent oxidoreductase [Candidatus Angelobacter sp.]
MAAKQLLKNKVAVITGGSRGIGFALARTLAENGCRVVITGRNTRNLKAAATKLSGSKGKVETVGCDVSDPVQVENLFAGVQKRHSTIDILINNAGVAHSLEPIEKLSIDVWKQVIDTNLTGMFLCTRAALLLMRTGATVVNNLSVAATQPFPGMAAYNASKYGALGFTRVLREEVRKRGIRVLALIVGATDTDIWNHFWPEAPRAKMVSPATIAEAVLQAVMLPENTTIEEIRLGPTAGVL